MVTRLSKKAQEAASGKAAELDKWICEYASLLAEYEGKDIADERHIEEAYQYVVRKVVEKFPKLAEKYGTGRG